MDHLEIMLTRPDGMVYALVMELKGRITLVTPEHVPAGKAVFRDLGKARLALIRHACQDTLLQGQRLPPPAVWVRYPDHFPQERPLLVIQRGTISRAHVAGAGVNRAVVIGHTPISTTDGAWWSYAP